MKQVIQQEPRPPLMRVRDWDRLYENNRSRDMKRTSWFPAPNDLSADGYVELVDHEHGAAHFGVWNAVLMVASKAKPCRGLLIKEDGRPHTSDSLARVIRLPETLVQVAVGRLLQIGLLEIVDPGGREINSLPSHPGAGNLPGTAASPREDATERKGTEHHHQEGNGKEKKGTELSGAQRTPECSSVSSSADFFQRTADDGANCEEVYASPEDELKAIYLAKAGEPITRDVFDAIRVNLELGRATMAEFVSVLRTHLAGNWKNPAGFLRSLSKNFRAKSQSASAPVTAAEAAEHNYRCQLCGSRVPGEGAIRGPNGLVLPCQCASPDYIARQRARGIFAQGCPQ